MSDVAPPKETHRPSFTEVLAMFLPQVMHWPESLQAWRAEWAAIERCVEALVAQSRETQQSLSQLSGEVRLLYQKQDALDHASQRDHLLTEQHFENRIIEPLARRIIPLIDLIQQQPAPDVPGDGSLNGHQILRAVEAQLLELLAEYGVECRPAVEEQILDARWMRPVELRRTPDRAMHHRVQRALRAGFVRGERILRPASVVLWTNTED